MVLSVYSFLLNLLISSFTSFFRFFSGHEVLLVGRSRFADDDLRADVGLVDPDGLQHLGPLLLRWYVGPRVRQRVNKL